MRSRTQESVTAAIRFSVQTVLPTQDGSFGRHVVAVASPRRLGRGSLRRPRQTMVLVSLRSGPRVALALGAAVLPRLLAIVRQTDPTIVCHSGPGTRAIQRR